MNSGRPVWLWILCGALFGPVHAQVPQFQDRDGAEGIQQVAYWTSSRLRSGEFAAVDAALDQFAADTARSRDGSPLLAGVADGLAMHCGRSPASGDALAQVRNWRRAHPGSVAGVLVESCLWRESAWTARGPGMASDVTEEGARLFAERLARAMDVLESSAAVGQRSALWYVDAMELLLGLGADSDRIEAVFSEGQRRFRLFDGLYLQMARTYLPQWGGSARTISPMMTRVLAGLPAERADALYARMWLRIQANTRTDIYELGAEWPRLQRGLRTLGKLYPRSDLNRARLLVQACHANDGDTYRTLRPTIDVEIPVDAFPRGTSLVECDERWAPALSRRSVTAEEVEVDRAIRSACGRAGEKAPRQPAEVVRLFPRLIEARRALRAYYLTDDAELAARIADNLGFLEQTDATDARAICGTVGYEGM